MYEPRQVIKGRDDDLLHAFQGDTFAVTPCFRVQGDGHFVQGAETGPRRREVYVEVAEWDSVSSAHVLQCGQEMQACD